MTIRSLIFSLGTKVTLAAGKGFSMLAGAIIGLALFGPATTHGPEDTTWQTLRALVGGILAGGLIWKTAVWRLGHRPQVKLAEPKR